MKPQLLIDGEPVLTGGSAPLGYSQRIYTSTLRPGSEYKTIDKILVVGSICGIAVATQQTPVSLVYDSATELSSLQTDWPETEATQEILNAIGLHYFASTSAYSDRFARMLDVHATRHISIGFFVNEVVPLTIFGYVYAVRYAGIHMDIKRDIQNPVSLTDETINERKWMELHGYTSSMQESLTLSLLFDVDSASTARIFAQAAHDNIPIHVFDNPETIDEDLTNICAWCWIKSQIKTVVNSGYTVIIPETSVSISSWTGWGWQILDENTGASAFMIGGYLHGPLHGGCIGEYSDGVVAAAKIAKKTWSILDNTVIAGTGALVGGGMIYGAGFLLGAGGAAAFCGAAFLAAAGGATIGAAGWITYILFKNTVFSLYFRRKKYVAC